MSIPIVIGPRQSGKTQVCVEFLLENLEHGLVIVSSETRRNDLMERLAKRTSTNPHAWHRHVVTINALNNLSGLPSKDVWIDQADHVLYSLLRGHHLNGVTWDA